MRERERVREREGRRVSERVRKKGERAIGRVFISLASHEVLVFSFESVSSTSASRINPVNIFTLVI